MFTRVFFAALPLLFVSPAASSLANAAGAASESDKTQADADWQYVIQSSSASTVDARDYAGFLKQIEIADRELRERGTAFWRKYPNDARRFVWLQLTVHLAPRYFSDIDASSRLQATLHRGNGLAIDRERRKAWAREFGEMKAEFMAADMDVTAKRFLLQGEVCNLYRESADSLKRGEDPQSAQLLSAIEAFLCTFPRETGPSDILRYCVSVLAVIRPLFERPAEFGLLEEDIRAFRDRNEAKLEKAARAQMKNCWSQYVRRASSQSTSADWSDLLPTYPSDQPISSAEQYVARRNYVVANRIHREMGLLLWDTRPDPIGRLRWLAETAFVRKALYLSDLRQGVYALTFGTEEPQEDRIAVEKWSSRYLEMRREALSDGRVAEPILVQLRKQVLNAEAGQSITDATMAVKWKRPVNLQALWKSVTDLYTVHGYADICVFNLGVIWNHTTELGLTSSMLREWTVPLLECEDELIRTAAQAKLSHLALRSGPLDLTGERTDGTFWNLTSLRGKWVVLDVWATTCESCIQAMPALKEIARDYRAHGVEVVSICIDGHTNAERLAAINRELKPEWITIIGGNLLQDIFEKYAFRGVPQYLILDPKGLLFADTSDVRHYGLAAVLASAMRNEPIRCKGNR